MSESIRIRTVTLEDVPALVRVHAGDEDPWGQVAMCAIAVNHRLLRPFHCDIAFLCGDAAGDAEWIASHEPAPVGRQLYLGMLHVRPEARGQDVGSAMVCHGRVRARALGCDCIRTCPEAGAVGFYRRCGLAPQIGTHCADSACGNRGADAAGSVAPRPPDDSTPKEW
ncbi:MAG: GNAT family N-acetyltransferase [Candidatus Latescibacterota bacterium]